MQKPLRPTSLSDGPHAPATSTGQRWQYQVHKWLKEGDPLNSDLVLHVLDLGVSSPISIDLTLPGETGVTVVW